jgi:hypothetical protein
MEKDLSTLQNNEQERFDFEDVKRILDEDLVKHHKEESFFFTFNNDRAVFAIFPYMDYIKLAKYRDSLIDQFSRDDNFQDKKIYMISGSDIKKKKNRWFKNF